MDESIFKTIISELAKIEADLGDAPQRARVAAVRSVLDVAVRMGRLERVVDALLPPEIPAPAAVWHAQRSAEARLALVREHGAWNAAEVAARAGSMAANRSALASAWRAAGRVVAVEFSGRAVFPAFQFDADAQPLPLIAGILTHLREAGLSDWQAALWFATPTGWLDDRRPVDLLADAPEAVTHAAARFHERPT